MDEDDQPNNSNTNPHSNSNNSQSSQPQINNSHGYSTVLNRRMCMFSIKALKSPIEL